MAKYVKINEKPENETNILKETILKSYF